MKMNGKTSSYFAAANGYCGFRDYFDDVFNPYRLEHIFILKGGPGTGKSSLMKTLLFDPAFKNFDKEAIYCSSDPASLDGVVIGDQVAVIDGTAPHSRDTKLPGVVDEIINLGENWDEKNLLKSTIKIKEINQRKSKEYNSAYKYLSICKNINNFILTILNECFDEKACLVYLKSLDLPHSSYEYKRPKTRLISSFGKDGYTRLDTLEKEAKTIYNISGKYGSESIFLNLLKGMANINEYIHFPTALAGELTEALYFEKIETAFLSNAGRGKIINSEMFFKISKEDESDLKALYEERCRLLDLSEKHFKEASNQHFLLEEIYISSMDFSKNAKLTEELIEKARQILMS